MGADAPCIIEAEYFTRDPGPPRQTGKELVERMFIEPEPLGSVRFYAVDPRLVSDIEACIEAERRRDLVRSKLQGLESIGRLERPYGRASVKPLAKRLAELGDTARRARARLEAAVAYALLLAASEHREIAVRDCGRYLPVDASGAAYLARELEGRRPSSIYLYRGGTLGAPSPERVLMLA